MPGTNELLGLLVIIFVIWLVLKVMRMAIKLILFMIAVVIIVGAFHWLMNS